MARLNLIGFRLTRAVGCGLSLAVVNGWALFRVAKWFKVQFPGPQMLSQFLD
jgi:uncharacterized membrane protein YedE/YeeE